MDDLLPPIVASDDEVDYANSSDEGSDTEMPVQKGKGGKNSKGFRSALPGSGAAEKVFAGAAKKAAKTASMFDDLLATAEPSAKRMKKDQAIDVSSWRLTSWRWIGPRMWLVVGQSNSTQQASMQDTRSAICFPLFYLAAHLRKEGILVV
jgi:hypothetical protein